MLSGQMLGLATFLLVQGGAAIWWASRISTEMRAVTTAIAALSAKLDKLEASVTMHETAIGIIKAMNDYERQATNGAYHERTR